MASQRDFGSRARRFDSYPPSLAGDAAIRGDRNRTALMHRKGHVAQQDRASGFGPEGWGFESLRAHHALVAQSG